MSKRLSWGGLALLAVCTVGLTAQGMGCSATVVEDDEGSGTTAGSGGGSTTTGTTSTTGTGGDGGSGAGNNSLCDQDCSAITTQDCFKAVCNEGGFPGPIGQCVVVPEDAGVTCDDGQFCTTNDACDGQGVCVGGPQNTCGMTAPECNEIICDEQSSSCTAQALTDGTMCTSTDLCLTGATCVAGACTGGVTKDCFFSPVPNECYVAVCNPVNGMCEPQIGNEGGGCTDVNDLCTVGKTCSNGMCQGGSPKDCSQLTQGCVNGVCDTMTGSCTTMPVPAGGMCQSAADQCNTGICDMMGNCNPNPVPNGTPCNDGQICTASDACQNGTCVGGSQITQCVAGDFCCPSGCTGATDNDCNIMTVTINAQHRGWWNSAGSHTSGNNNTLTGRSGSSEYNSYFTFDLTSLSGSTVITAELHIELENYQPSTLPTQDISVWDVNTPAMTVEATGTSTAIFQDLMTGNQYGSLTGIQSTDIGQILIIPLGPAAITDLQSKLGTNNFAVGVHNETSMTTGQWVRFSASNETRTHQLVLDVL